MSDAPKRRGGAPKGTMPPNAGKGRPKGSVNKINADVQEKLRAIGCDPLVGMARLAMDRKNTKELRGRMYAELAQYVAPKRRAIEHSTDLPTLEALLGQLGDGE